MPHCAKALADRDGCRWGYQLVDEIRALSGYGRPGAIGRLAGMDQSRRVVPRSARGERVGVGGSAQDCAIGRPVVAACPESARRRADSDLSRTRARWLSAGDSFTRSYRRSRVCRRCVAITVPLIRIRWLGLTAQIAMLNHSSRNGVKIISAYSEVIATDIHTFNADQFRIIVSAMGMNRTSWKVKSHARHNPI